ncbi:hypothetical protein ABZ960_28720 [Streptomyces pseudovenezuelae]|uniref:hypothetical protein n=1 Tax=Streptomyces TaxID=1883 RepID=UPI0004CA222E|nr:hypothetical protein [Streptomyces sp. NRRL WC-3774]
MITNRAMRRVSRVVVGAAVGGAAAWALRLLDAAGREYTFTFGGVVVGALLAGAADFYRRTVRLTEIRVSVPQLSELTFVVNDDTRQVSWQLFVESVTRISTQRLNDDDGLIREALTSLYGLFATTRDILRTARPSAGGNGITVEYLAVNLLNRELRPFLSKWHPRLRQYETAFPNAPEAEWADAAECRRHLALVQAHTREYVMGFARLAGVVDPELMLGGIDVPGHDGGDTRS